MVMSPNENDETGITDPPEGKPPVGSAESLPNEEVDPEMIGPPVKIAPTDDNEPKTA